MSDDRANIAVPRDAYAAMADAMRRAVIDSGASKATHKAAFSALLALVDAGLIRTPRLFASERRKWHPPKHIHRRGCVFTG
jgi:hypothetical protein